MKWGRNESVIWPPHGPVNTYGAIFLSFVAVCSFVYLRFAFALMPLQQFYLPYYVRSGIEGLMHKTDKYELVMVLPKEGPARVAVNDDVISRKKKPAPGVKQIPLELSPAGISKGLLYVYQQPKTSYLNKLLNSYFQATIYGGEDFWEAEPSLTAHALPPSMYAAQLPPEVILQDIKTAQQGIEERIPGPTIALNIVEDHRNRNGEHFATAAHVYAADLYQSVSKHPDYTPEQRMEQMQPSPTERQQWEPLIRALPLEVADSFTWTGSNGTVQSYQQEST
jgi:hypothetical protein